MQNRFTYAVAVASAVILGFGAAVAEAAGPDTTGFLAACLEDPVVVEEPGLEQPGGKSTPEIYCQCIAGKLVEHKISQTDVDLVTKLHNEELSDQEASEPGLDDVLSTNEIIEDECKVSLGLPFPTDDAPLEDE